MKPSGLDRQVARRLSVRAETAAAWLLRFKFFRILARNYRIRDGEIDLIARRGALVVFVEVKARPSLVSAMEAVGTRKQARMARAARHWIATHPASADCSFRADGVFVTPSGLPKHVPGLFDLDFR